MRAFIERTFKSITNPADKPAVELKLRQTINKAVKGQTLWTTDWARTPVITAHEHGEHQSNTADCVCTECAEDSAEQEGEPAKKKAKKKTGKKTGKLSASALAFTPGGGGDDGDAREGIGDRGGDEEEEEGEEEDVYEQEFRKLQAKVVEVKIRVSCVGSECMIEIVNG